MLNTGLSKTYWLPKTDAGGNRYGGYAQIKWLQVDISVYWGLIDDYIHSVFQKGLDDMEGLEPYRQRLRQLEAERKQKRAQLALWVQKYVTESAYLDAARHTICFVFGHKWNFCWRAYPDNGYHLRVVNVGCVRCKLIDPSQSQKLIINNAGEVGDHEDPFEPWEVKD